MINKQVDFNEYGYNLSLTHLRNKVLPAVNNVIAEYNRLVVLPKFTPEVWKELVTTNGESVINDYTSIAKKDAAKFTLPSLKDLAFKEAEAALQKFRKAWTILNEKLNDSRLLDTTFYTLDYIIINGKGEADINESILKELFTMRIENETQEKIYTTGKKIEAAFEELWQIYKSAGIECNNLEWVDDTKAACVFGIDQDGKVYFNTWALNLV